MGEKTGVGKQICDLVPQARCVGAVAHVLQLCVGDVDDIVDYFILFREIISQIIAQYQLSGKRKHALEELAQLLNGFVYKLRGIHGIRAAATYSSRCDADRLYLCRHLAGALFERFNLKSGLSDLQQVVVMAFSVLNHKY